MYLQPFMFDGTHGKRAWATCQALAGVWVEGLARQQQAHADTVSSFYASQLNSLRTLCEAEDTAQFAARLMSCAVPDRFGITELSVRLGAIAMDTHQKFGAVMGSHANEVTRLLVQQNHDR